jgi:magnesium transporter
VEARLFRDGALDPDPLRISDLGSLPSLGDGTWLWVDAVEPGDEDLERLRSLLDLHELAIEDVRHRDQRPKIELYPTHVFAVFRPVWCEPDGLAESELFLFVSERFLITIRFPPLVDLDPAVARWRVLADLAPGTGSALYAIADEVVDGYLEAVEELEDRADDLEDEVFRSARPEGDGGRLQLEVLRLRRDAVRLRRHAVPMRQAIDRLADDAGLVTGRLVPYVRDVTDHLLRAIELTDGVREILTTVVDIRMAQAANQLNEVMKKLTAGAGIVLVPTLIAGIYGMNFDHMPELDWLLGYPVALGLMVLSAVALWVWFRRRGWL